jgi:hypothetical protein
METTNTNIGYCVRCHEKRAIKNAHATTLKNGKPAVQGICSVCGTNMTVITKKV